jgi:protein-tyrosine phosphatase
MGKSGRRKPRLTAAAKRANPMKLTDKYGVLFVCLGNICRSPLAEGIFRQLVTQQNMLDLFLIDSCGTGAWHVGESPHIESQKIAKKYKISLAGQKARQINTQDYNLFQLMVAMDCSNKEDISSHPYAKKSRIICLREYDSEKGSLDVPDPYYGPLDGFEQVFRIIERCCHNLLLDLKDKIKSQK